MQLLSPINVATFNKSLKGSNKSLTESKNILGKMIQNSVKRTKVKRDSFAQIKSYRNKRNEYSIRQELEDELEAPNVVVNPDGPTRLANADTSKSFFERIIGFLGYVSAGWLLRNLPTWIGMGKEFIARINKAGEILSGSIGNMIDIFGGMGKVIGAYAQNLARFDFLDTENRVKIAMDGLNQSFGSFQNRIEEAFGLITTPLTEGKYSGEKIPPVGSEAQDQGAYAPAEPYSPSSGNMSENQKQALNILSKYESAAGGYNAVNQIGIAGGRGVSGFSGDFRKMRQHGGKALTDMTIAEIMSLQAPRPGMSNQEWISQGRLHAVGRYQFIGGTLPGVVKRAGIPTTAKFTPEVQDLLALQYLKEAGIGAWIGPSDRATPQERAIIEQARREPINFRPSISSGSSTRQTSVASGQPSSSSSVQIQSQPTLVTSGFGWRWGRQHQGIDLAVKNGKTEGTPLIIKKSGIVDYAFIGRGNMGQVMITHEDGTQSRYLHVNNFKVSSGQKIGPGQIIAYLAGMGQPGIGNATGPHLHFEYYPSKSSGPVNPASVYNNYVSLGGKVFGNTGNPLDSGYTPRASSPSQRAPAQITATPSSTQQRAAIPSAITPDRTPQDIMVYQPPSQQNIITSYDGGEQAPTSSPINDFDLLNNFIKNKLLLDLAYL